MAKVKVEYTCSSCGGNVSRWQGQCPHCKAWNTLQEVIAAPKTKRFVSVTGTEEGLHLLKDFSPREETRYPTGIGEFDRVLGGGLVSGAVVLIGGDPGVGKSTLLLQALTHTQKKFSALYISGEESGEQIALRAQRLQISPGDLLVLPEIMLERVLAIMQQTKAEVIVIDSIQTIYSESLSSAPGSVSQVRECAAQLTRHAKQTGSTVILVGHVTKDGTLAGPRVLEHIVDTVLYFEGDTHSSFRLIRAFKNRFGAVNELGVFAMTDKGLKGVNNPSAIFLSQHEQTVSGSCVMVTQEGTRPLLVEIQALVDNSHSASPRRLTVGVEQNRLAMLIAVLHRHAAIACFDQDVFVNAVGGVKITEPAADLAIVMAMVSSLQQRPLPRRLVVFGEVGLTGEIRPAPRGQERLKEAVKLGFTTAIIPKANTPRQPISGLTVIAVDRLEEAVSCLRDLTL